MVHPFHYVSAAEALSIVQSGQRIFIHGSACTPVYMLHQLALEAERLRNVELVFISVQGDIEVDKPRYADAFHINCLLFLQQYGNR